MLIPAGETKPVRLLVETSGDAGGGGGVPDPGWGSARARSGSMSGLPRPTAGETGTLEATVVDKEGNVVKGADVSVYDGGERVEGMLTTAEGKVSIGAPDGHLHRQSHQTRLPAVGEGGTSRSGSAGRPTSGIVPLDKENFFAEIRVKSPSRVAPRSAQTRQYEMTLRNAGRNDDTYALSVEGLPEQWYARFRESREATEGGLRDLRAGRPRRRPSTSTSSRPTRSMSGEYNFTVLIDSAARQYEEDLTLRLRGSYTMRTLHEELPPRDQPR